MQNRIIMVAWQRWLACALVAMLWHGSAQADTIRLKDGTVYEGTILSEDSLSVTMEVRRAGGTIVQRLSFKKSDIAEMQRLTEEEKRARQIQEEYEQLQSYQLDARSSYALADYDRVIETVFEAFLTRYPDSPHEADVRSRLEQWRAEREMVASGMVKFQGRWMGASEAATLRERQQAQRAIEEGRALVTEGKHDQAARLFELAAKAEHNPQLAREGARLAADAYRHWLGGLATQTEQLKSQIAALEKEASQLGREHARAERELEQLRQRYSRQTRRTMEQSLALTKKESEVRELQNRINLINTQLTNRRHQQVALQQAMSQIQSRATELGVGTVVADASAATQPSGAGERVVRGQTEPVGPDAYIAPPPDREAYAADTLQRTRAWVERNWGLVAVVGVLFVWAAWRFMNR
jgi:tetratricopeptide (TPR) repeat protein